MLGKCRIDSRTIRGFELADIWVRLANLNGPELWRTHRRIDIVSERCFPNLGDFGSLILTNEVRSRNRDVEQQSEDRSTFCCGVSSSHKQSSHPKTHTNDR
jgi:hypothetical protein